MPEPLVPASVAAYGLEPPARLLMPGFVPVCGDRRTQIVKLGNGSDAAELQVRTWGSCPGCGAHPLGADAGRTVYLKVPCDALPHCTACECGNGHGILLADGQVAELRAALSATAWIPEREPAP